MKGDLSDALSSLMGRPFSVEVRHNKNAFGHDTVSLLGACKTCMMSPVAVDMDELCWFIYREWVDAERLVEPLAVIFWDPEMHSNCVCHVVLDDEGK